MHGDDPGTIAAKVADMTQRRAEAPAAPAHHLRRHRLLHRPRLRSRSQPRSRPHHASSPTRNQSPAGFANFQQWTTGSKLEKKLSLRDYSVSNRGLHSGLIGTPETVAQRLADFEGAGCSLVLLQSSPQHEEMARFARQVMVKPGR